MLNDYLIKRLKTELSFLRLDWEEADEAREYALAAMMALDNDGSDDMALALCEFESAENRLKAIEDDIAFLEGQIREEEEERAIVND